MTQMMKTMMATAGMSLLLAGPLWAQQPADRPAVALEILIGEWDGTGWASGPDGERREFRVHEDVASHAAGHGVSLQGTGWSQVDGTEQVVHDAFALVWAGYDGTYHIRSVVMQGYSVEAEIEPGDGGFEWGFAAGPMEFRYTASVEGDVWHEVGERRTEDAPDWVVFLEMTLERVD